MTNQKVLELAIRKAINGGWESNGAKPESLGLMLSFDIRGLQEFSKALWGEDRYESDEGYVSHRGSLPVDKDWRETFMETWDFQMPAWAYHLASMVIADDPLEYLKENI